ncbi:leucyl aminopeptidase, partial [Paracoccus thiocyanatus]
MTHPVEISFTAMDAAGLAERQGRVAILVPKAGRLPVGLPRATREALGRAFASDAWKGVKPGKALELAFPAGLKAEALQLVLLPADADAKTARAAAPASAPGSARAETLVLAGNHARG